MADWCLACSNEPLSARRQTLFVLTSNLSGTTTNKHLNQMSSWLHSSSVLTGLDIDLEVSWNTQTPRPERHTRQPTCGIRAWAQGHVMFRADRRRHGHPCQWPFLSVDTVQLSVVTILSRLHWRSACDASSYRQWLTGCHTKWPWHAAVSGPESVAELIESGRRGREPSG